MLAAKILKTCKDQGVTLHVLEGGRLKVRGPKGRLKNDLLRSIKAEKENLIRLLSGATFFDKHIDAAIAELNNLGIRMMDVPESKRQEAFVLEGKLTRAANAGDRELFLEFLEKWRRCFN